MLAISLISVLLAEIFVALLFLRVPLRLSTHTDVIGYPLYANYNIERLYSIYTLQIGVFTVLALTFYWLLSRHRTVKSQPAQPPPRPMTRAQTLSAARGGSLPRLFLVGFVLALGTVAYPSLISSNFLAQVTLLAGVYAAFCVAFASMAPSLLSWRRGGSFEMALSRLNSLAVPFTIFAIYGISRASHVVEQGGTRTGYNWLPAWLALSLFALAMGWTVRRLKAAENEEDLVKAETSLLLGIVLPVLIYLVTAQIPPATSWVHFYHDGESLVPASLIQKGFFPWRDFLFVHGLLQDPFMALLGQKLFQNSIWGAAAGNGAYYMPLYQLAHYALSLHLFGTNPLYLVLTSVLLPIFNPALYFFNLRFILLPLIFLLLSKTMQSKRKSLGLILGALLAIQVILAPEGALIAIAASISLGALEVYQRDRGRFWLTQLTQSTALLLGASVVFAVWLVFLAAHGALAAYFTCYTDFGLDYRFGAGIPPKWSAFPGFTLHVLFPPITHFLFCGYFLYLARCRRLTPDAFLILGMNLFSILYYAKFFARADEHIEAHVEIALPIMLWLIFRALSTIEFSWQRSGLLVDIRKRFSAHPVTLVLVGLVFFSSVNDWKQLFQNFPERFGPNVGKRSRSSRVGYKIADRLENRVLSDFDALFARYLIPTDRIFDFTNEPALFYYFLDRLPASRYIYVNMALTGKSHRRLLDELELTRPKLVVYSTRLGYDAVDGVPGAVRHYEVARYLLDHYHPLADLKHHLVLIRNEERDIQPKRHSLSLVASRMPLAIGDLSSTSRGSGPDRLTRERYRCRIR